MKSLVRLCVVIAWITMSCSTDNEFNSDPIGATTITPQNSANMYDHAGAIYHDFIQLHNKDTVKNMQLADIDKQVRMLWKNYGYKTPKSEPLALPTNDTLTNKNLKEVLNNANLSATAKESFLVFLDEIINLHTDYESWYANICSFENDVAQQENWTTEDRRVILTTTSLIRYTGYTLYSEEGEGEEDEDWDVAIGNLVSMINGALSDTPAAISNALFYTLRH